MVAPGEITSVDVSCVRGDIPHKALLIVGNKQKPLQLSRDRPRCSRKYTFRLHDTGSRCSEMRVRSGLSSRPDSVMTSRHGSKQAMEGKGALFPAVSARAAILSLCGLGGQRGLILALPVFRHGRLPNDLKSPSSSGLGAHQQLLCWRHGLKIPGLR